MEKEHLILRNKAVEAAISEIRKAYGKAAIMKMDEKEGWDIPPSISTGSEELDEAIGIGGIPKGRIVEIFGHESSGKSTICLHAVAKAQENDGVAAYIDAEHAFDPAYARRIGVDVNNMLLSQPDSAEEALDIVETLIRSGGVDLVVIDSVAALVPKDELTGEITDQFVGLQARIMSRALRRLTGITAKTGCILVFINQLREKIGIRFGNPETTPGGRALKFFSSLRLDVRRIEKLVKGDEVIGSKVRVSVVKNKVAPPFGKAEIVLSRNSGIDKEAMLLERGLATGCINRAGSWFSFGNEKLGQGKEAAAELLKNDKSLFERVAQSIREKAENSDKRRAA